MEPEQTIQETQYSYPYHYIPQWENNIFSQTRHWSWGFRYLGGMKVVFDQLDNFSFSSLIDIGCGDGRFVREVKKRYPEKNVLGVDYSERAINLARVLNPDLAFEDRDIITNPLDRTFNVATLIEVVEHIPPNKLKQFVKQVHAVLSPEGYLILTVPHVNKSVSDKHYQHFDAAALRDLLDTHFQKLRFIPFDSHSKFLTVMQLLLGGKGNHFVLTNSWINSVFLQVYFNRFLYEVTEENCGRIAVVGRARPSN